MMNTTTTKLPAHFKGNYGTMYYVKNMKKAVAFYRDVIGLTPQFEEDGWSQFDLGGSALCLHPAGDNVQLKPQADKSTATNGILIIEVTDIRKVVNSLKEKRVEFIGDVTDMGECGMCADFKDLDGNIIGLFQMPASACAVK